MKLEDACGKINVIINDRHKYRRKSNMPKIINKVRNLSPEELVALAEKSRNAHFFDKIKIFVILVIINGLPIIAKHPIKFLQGYFTSVFKNFLSIR